MSRNYFQPIPFVRIFSLFAVGVVVASLLGSNSEIYALLITFLLVLQVILWRLSNYSVNQLKSLLLMVSITASGALYQSLYHFGAEQHSNKRSYFLAEVCQQPAEKKNTFQTILKVQSKENPQPEGIVAYFEKTDFDSSITTGDQLVILGKLQPIKNAGNPFEFDYQTMMSRRKIFNTVYLSKGSYLKTGKSNISINNLAEKVRDILVQRLSSVLPDKEERSVVCALTLGYRTELDQDTLDYFASTGAMHVLSVSGLHVALLYMILAFALSFLNRKRGGRVLFAILMITFLWGYAFISGFSPPVQRATVMLSFVIVGNNIRRPVNVYNSLAASAFVLLLLNPFVLFDVGFQLSYLAILGIVLIQPALNGLFNLKNKILAWLWALFTVSVAAQVITFPLGIYYFNQFPNFFWLSNFVVVPITTIIMWLALAFFVLLPFPLVPQLLGFLIQKLTWAMLAALKVLDHHPLAVSKGLVLSGVQVFLLYGIIVLCLIFFFSKQKNWLYGTLALLVSFQISNLFEKSRLMNQHFVLVYNTKSTIIHLVNGRTNYLLLSEQQLPEADEKMIGKVCDHLRLNKPVCMNRNTIKSVKKNDLSIISGSVRFLNCSICFLEKMKNGKSEEILIRTVNPLQTAVVSTGYPPSGKKSENKFFTKAGGAYQLILSEK